MTTYVDPVHIDVLVARAESEPCTCLWVLPRPGAAMDAELDQCLRCLTLGLLRPSVTAHEVPF